MKYKQCHLLPSINRRVTPQGLRAQTICGSERDFLRIRRRSDDGGGGGGSGILISARQRRMASLHIHTKFSFLSQFFWGHLLSLPMRARDCWLLVAGEKSSVLTSSSVSAAPLASMV